MMMFVSSREALLIPLMSIEGIERRSTLPDMRMKACSRRTSSITNEANLTGGENVGSTAAAPAAPEASGDDDVGGNSDPEPERRPPTRKTRTRNTPPAAGSLPTTSTATPPHLDTLPDAAFVRLPEVCRLYAIAPATAWRWVKAGKIPTPLKLSDRVTAWRVGDLRASLAQLAA